ncbi:MAG TPA: Maf family protein [Bryobacteraceae bacterium]|nr:Maf family protein [Bryobacteraceae bacterium]
MLVLASASPRRRELLQQAGIPCSVRPAPGVDESPYAHEGPEQYVQRLAEEKAMAVEAAPVEIVLGADTVVVVDGRLLGKPQDDADAARMLHALSGRRHEVMTGICLRSNGRILRDWAVTQVWFTVLSARDIEEYVATGEPLDKAGAYAIQGIASRFTDRIDGEYSNVVGLPVALVWKHLRGLEEGA